MKHSNKPKFAQIASFAVEGVKILPNSDDKEAICKIKRVIF